MATTAGTNDNFPSTAHVTSDTISIFKGEKDNQQDEDLTFQTEGTGSLLVTPTSSKFEFDTATPTGSCNDELMVFSFHVQDSNEDNASLVSAISLNDTVSNCTVVHSWDQSKFLSNYIQDGLKSLKREDSSICMVFENPCSSSPEPGSFYTGSAFKFHDYPPSPPLYKAILTPCRYSMVNGSVYPSYLQNGSPPEGLMEHWIASIPGFKCPYFVKEIPTDGLVYNYLPMENVANSMNDPFVHYHLCGKDALPLSTYLRIRSLIVML